MIYLFTGLNGSGKTQRAILQALEWSKEGRPVFYWHIPFKFVPAGWHECEPKNWQTLPPNSVLLVDECQNYFVGGTMASHLPKWVLDMAEHRHLGIDFLFVTPNPSMIAKFVRELVGEWWELSRLFGKNASNVKIRNKCSDTAEILSNTLWHFDKRIWALYESSKKHTAHGRVPFKVKAYILLAVAVVAFVFYAFSSSKVLRGKASPIAESVAANVSVLPSSPATEKSKAPEPEIVSARTDCPVLVGTAVNHDRQTAFALLENEAGHTIRVSIPPKGLSDDWTWRGCRYYLAGGSLISVDSGRAVASKLARLKTDESGTELQSLPLQEPAPFTPAELPRQSKPVSTSLSLIPSKPSAPKPVPAASLRPVHNAALNPVPVKSAPLR